MVNFHLVDNEDNDVNIIIIIELTHSKTLLENSLKIKSQPATLDFENLSCYSNHS